MVEAISNGARDSRGAASSLLRFSLIWADLSVALFFLQRLVSASLQWCPRRSSNASAGPSSIDGSELCRKDRRQLDTRGLLIESATHELINECHVA